MTNAMYPDPQRFYDAIERVNKAREAHEVAAATKRETKKELAEAREAMTALVMETRPTWDSTLGHRRVDA